MLLNHAGHKESRINTCAGAQRFWLMYTYYIKVYIIVSKMRKDCGNHNPYASCRRYKGGQMFLIMHTYI